MKWLLTFRRKKQTEPGGRICQRVDCAEGELEGEKERLAMEFERKSGEPWVCCTIVPIPEMKRRNHDD